MSQMTKLFKQNRKFEQENMISLEWKRLTNKIGEFIRYIIS